MSNSISNSPTIRLAEVVKIMRDNGFRTSEKTVADLIEAGKYPFGELVRTGTTGRRTFVIFAVDFEKWLESKVITQ